MFSFLIIFLLFYTCDASGSVDVHILEPASPMGFAFDVESDPPMPNLARLFYVITESGMPTTLEVAQAARMKSSCTGSIGATGISGVEDTVFGEVFCPLKANRLYNVFFTFDPEGLGNSMLYEETFQDGYELPVAACSPTLLCGTKCCLQGQLCGLNYGIHFCADQTERYKYQKVVPFLNAPRLAKPNPVEYAQIQQRRVKIKPNIFPNPAVKLRAMAPVQPFFFTHTMTRLKECDRGETACGVEECCSPDQTCKTYERFIECADREQEFNEIGTLCDSARAVCGETCCDVGEHCAAYSICKKNRNHIAPQQNYYPNPNPSANVYTPPIQYTPPINPNANTPAVQGPARFSPPQGVQPQSVSPVQPNSESRIQNKNTQPQDSARIVPVKMNPAPESSEGKNVSAAAPFHRSWFTRIACILIVILAIYLLWRCSAPVFCIQPSPKQIYVSRVNKKNYCGMLEDDLLREDSITSLMSEERHISAGYVRNFLDRLNNQ